MASYIDANKLLTKKQSGFHRNHSYVSALLDVFENIRHELDEGKLNFFFLFDHAKDFDTIDHGMLFMKLVHFFYFAGASTRLLSSYLSNCSQFVLLVNG